jgi:hypothetical protein
MLSLQEKQPLILQHELRALRQSNDAIQIGTKTTLKKRTKEQPISNSTKLKIGSIVEVLVFVKTKKDDIPKYYKGVVARVFVDSFYINFDDGEMQRIEKSAKWRILQ